MPRRQIYQTFPLYVPQNGLVDGQIKTWEADRNNKTTTQIINGSVEFAYLGGAGAVRRAGYNSQIQHGGVDIGAPVGTPLVSVYDGTAYGAKGGSPCGWNVTLISADKRYKTVYCHMSAISEKFMGVTVPVKAGELVGRVGGGGVPGSGNARDTSPHLHIQTEILNTSGIKTGWYLQPLAYLQQFENTNTSIAQSRGVFQGAKWKWKPSDNGKTGYGPPAARFTDDNAAETVTLGPFRDASTIAKLTDVLEGRQGNATGGRRTDGRNRSQATGAGASGAVPEVSSAAAKTYISPYIALLDSFHPKIQYELSRRRVASETANTHMPFVRLTSLTKVLRENIEGESAVGTSVMPAWCPSLGLVGQTEESFDDILSPTTGKSKVGWATAEIPGSTPIEHKRIAMVVENSSDDPPNIPPPGIVSVNAERSLTGPMGVRGGLFRANLKIVAYSLGQFNALLRYFLRPGTRVVLEMGRMSTSTTEQPVTHFNWKRSLSTLTNYFADIVLLRVGQRKMIEEFIYNNFGNYELFVGYVANFKTKYTKNNTYEMELTIHSVQQFEVPIKATGANAICAGEGVTNSSKALDLEEYFKPENAKLKINNFYNVLSLTQAEEDNELSVQWRDHVIPLRGTGTDAPHADTNQPGYLVSWQFFINVILRSEYYGMLSTLQIDSIDDVDTLNLMKGHMPPEVFGSAQVDRKLFLRSYEVNWHKNLRSTNPGVMIIDNTIAQTAQSVNNAYEQLKAAGLIDLQENNPELGEDTVNNVKSRLEAIRTAGVVSAFTPDANREKSSLTRGVWLNSSAIVEAFSSTDIISNGLAKLLNMMNAATEGYWNLQILSDDVNKPGSHIVDMGMSTPNNKKLLPAAIDRLIGQGNLENELKYFTEGQSDTQKEKPQYLYTFNRGTTTYDTDDIGGELLDVNIESDMPNVVAVQVISGVGGIAQRGTLQAIDINELRRITMVDTYPNACPPPSTNNTSQPPLLERDRAGNRIQRDADGNVVGSSEQDILTDDELRQLSQKVNTFRIVAAEEGLGEDAIEDYAREQIDATLQQRYGVPRRRTGFFGRIIDFLTVGNINGASYAYLRNRAQEEVEAAQNALGAELSRNNSGLLSLVKQYAGMFGNALELIEYDKSKMVQQMDSDANSGTTDKIHAFNSSNLTKTTVDLTIPGIGGIQLLQAFWVDRTPKILNKGYYVVTKIIQDFTIEKGWITKIQGRFRYQATRDAFRERREPVNGGT